MTPPARRSAQARGFLFADLRGYTAFVEARCDSAAAELLRTYRATVRRVIAEFDGAEIRTEGDSFYVVFPSASDAVLAGLAILTEAAQSPAEAPLRVGIGVHAGETAETDEGYVGWAVNIAARVCAAAGAGELFVTDTVRALTRGQVAFRFVARGRRRLKGVAEPVALFAVTSAEAPLPLRRSYATRLRGLAAGRLDRLALPVALAVGVLILTAGAIALIGPTLGGRAQEVQSPAATVPAGAPQPSPEPEAGEPADTRADAEERLLGRIDQDVARHCSPAAAEDAPEVVPRIGFRLDPAAPGERVPAFTDAGLRCSLGGGVAPEQVEYWQISTEVQVEEAIALLASERNVPPGDCASEPRGSGRWTFGTFGGHLLCTAFGGEALIAWTYDGETVMGLAMRSDSDVARLLEWWEANARLLGE